MEIENVRRRGKPIPSHAQIKPYTPDEVREYLQNPDYHAIPDQTSSYQGPHINQGSDPTCTAWAITHATWALGCEPDPTQTASLLNATLPSTDKRRRGLSLLKLAQIINDDKYPIEATLVPLGSIYSNMKNRTNRKAHVRETLQTVDENTKIVGAVVIPDQSTLTPNPFHALLVDNIDRDNNLVHVVDSANPQTTHELTTITHQMAHPFVDGVIMLGKR